MTLNDLKVVKSVSKPLRLGSTFLAKDARKVHIDPVSQSAPELYHESRGLNSLSVVPKIHKIDGLDSIALQSLNISLTTLQHRLYAEFPSSDNEYITFRCNAALNVQSSPDSAIQVKSIDISVPAKVIVHSPTLTHIHWASS